jgi:PAS domain S-box-containing protein
MGDGGSQSELEALQRENAALRLRVAELQRAGHSETGSSLVEREELLRDAERVAHLGTWTWDFASGGVSWSDELYRILGLEPGSITPSPESFMRSVHADDRAYLQAELEKTARAGVMPPSAFRVVRVDGSIRHVTGSSVMVLDARGQPRRMVGGVLDRTESLEAEVTLRHTLELLEEAQRFAQLGSWRMDIGNRELEWSAEFRRIAGLPADVRPSTELFLQCVIPEDRARFEARYRAAQSHFVTGETEGRLQRPDGQIRHVRLHGFAVTGRSGRTELRGTMLDVTDQVRLREELAQAQKMEAVGRLAGGIAHDFNNLLTVILGNLDLLEARSGSLPEIENSLQAVSSASNLTRRLLAFGRKAQLSLKLVPPNVLVRTMTALMQRLVGDEVRLEIDLAPELPEVRMDPLEMERALVNLVVNARDAMPAGGVVRIATDVCDVDGVPHVRLSVADEGPGIDEAVRPHIFEPFYTTKSDSGGTGLGLATVLGTAEQHGGTVQVEPRSGGGTIFSIVLPAAHAAEVGVAALRPNPELSPRSARPLQLLIVDDDTKVAEVTRRLLEGRGHAVRVATRPEQALQIWAEHGATLDLVICDVVMAQMRGPALVARMAAHGVSPRVLFITGYSEEAVHAELGHPVVTKPFTTDVLLAAVFGALGEQGSRGE